MKTFKQYLQEAKIINSKSNKPQKVVGYRYETKNNEKIKFYAKDINYSVSFVRTKENIPSSVSDEQIRNKIKQVNLTLNNPLYVEMNEEEFSDPIKEQVFIAKAIREHYDSIIFADPNSELDEFYVTVSI